MSSPHRLFTLTQLVWSCQTNPASHFSLLLLPCQDIVDFTSISTSGDYMRFPAARDVACQTDAPKSRAVGTQLSAKTLRPFLGRKGIYLSIGLDAAANTVQCCSYVHSVLFMINYLCWYLSLTGRLCLAALSHHQTTRQSKAPTQTHEAAFKSAFQRPRNLDGPRQDAELN